MHVYHLVACSNVDATGMIFDPRAVRHGTVEHGQVGALAGPIDPLTHLNLDFDVHRLAACVVVEDLALGSAVHFTDDGFVLAYPDPAAFHSLGRVDQATRRMAWLSQTGGPRA